MKKQGSIFQTKKKHKTSSETYLNEMEITNLPNTAFKIIVTKILTEVKRTHNS